MEIINHLKKSKYLSNQTKNLNLNLWKSKDSQRKHKAKAKNQLERTGISLN